MMGYRKTVKLLKIQLEDKKSKREVLLDRVRKNHNEKRRLVLEENSSTIRSIRNLKNYERQMDPSNEDISVVCEEFKFLDNFESDIYGTVNRDFKRLQSIDALSIRTATNAPLGKRHRPSSFFSQLDETKQVEDQIIEVSDRYDTSNSDGYSSIEPSDDDEWLDEDEAARGSIQMSLINAKKDRRPKFFLDQEEESIDENF